MRCVFLVLTMLLRCRIRTVRALSTRRGSSLPSLVSSLTPEATARVQRCIGFLNEAAEPFTCVESVVQTLLKSNFVELSEAKPWTGKLAAGGKYFFTRNRSSIVAFAVGGKYQSGNRFKIVGAHTDSPNLKVKPKSRKSGSGLTQLSVQTYGGGLWHTWFDRDLSVAGRVLLRESGEGEERFAHRLVRVERPLLRIPNLAIHLLGPDEKDAFKVNKEDHLAPVLCGEVKSSLVGEGNGTASAADGWAGDQCAELLAVLAAELGCDASAIVDFELSLYDTQRAAVSGARGEFLCSSRLDNLASCFVALEALTDHASELQDDADVSAVALFDHEEVGSESSAGAGSTLMMDAVARVTEALAVGGVSSVDSLRTALARSFVVSADMAHAVHPNYASKHEAGHAPRLNGGLVIKSNANQRYATTGVTAFVVRELASRQTVPTQSFVVRNDCACGSTIGPIISANTGMRAVDVGMPQLSMHSIREMMGGEDLTHGYRFMRGFLRDFGALDSAMAVDGDGGR